MPSVNQHSSPSIRIGTRKSPLALAQAHMVEVLLLKAHPDLRVEIVAMSTTGDKLLSGPLAEVGGKGLFTKELEEALFDGRVDIAVHSAKDMQTQLPEGLMLACALEREDARDVFLSGSYANLADLPEGAVLGTASLRRAAQALRLRPDLNIVPFRGNVQTRLTKLKSGEAHATLLALAGLKRLKFDPIPGTPLPLEDFLPAVGQGIIGIECRVEDYATRALLAPLNHEPSILALTCERALLAGLDGSCRTPIAGHAIIQNGNVYLRAMLASIDGKACFFAESTGIASQAEKLGHDIANELRHKAGFACSI